MGFALNRNRGFGSLPQPGTINLHEQVADLMRQSDAQQTPAPPATNLPPAVSLTPVRKSRGEAIVNAPHAPGASTFPVRKSGGEATVGQEPFLPGTSNTGVDINTGQGGPSPFGGDRPGESRLYEGAKAPIQNMIQTLTDQYRGLPTTEQIRTDIFGSGLPSSLQNAFGTTPEARADFMNIAQQLLAPQRQTAQGDLQNQAAATGIGGGRLGRALAQQQRDFGQQDLDITQQLLGRELDAQSQIGNTLGNLFGSELQGRRGEALNILGQLSPLAISQSQLPAQILQAFKSPTQ